MEALEAIQQGAAGKPIFDPTSCVIYTVLGASGDLAKKKIFPALCNLFEKKVLPPSCQIIGFARSKVTVPELAEKCKAYMKAKDDQVLEEFWSRVTYTQGGYDSDGFGKLAHSIQKLEKKHASKQRFRLYYLALPPTVFINVCTQLKQHCWSKNVSCRVIVEKPFGRDMETSNELSAALTGLFREHEIYRIDHYLGKEMVLNLIILRFGNELLRSVWNRDKISNVVITFKEDFGTAGRAGYFDTSGIIRFLCALKTVGNNNNNNNNISFCIPPRQNRASKLNFD
eukprot:sb/3467793/